LGVRIAGRQVGGAEMVIKLHEYYSGKRMEVKEKRKKFRPAGSRKEKVPREVGLW